MKKLISVLAVSVFALGMAQETPKKSCCAGKSKKDAKSCDMASKKSCDTKDKKDKSCCDMHGKSTDAKSKKEAKKQAKKVA